MIETEWQKCRSVFFLLISNRKDEKMARIELDTSGGNPSNADEKSNSIVKSLTNSLKENAAKAKTNEEDIKDEEIVNETPTEKEEEEIENTIVDDDLLKALDLPKFFLGKKLSEVGKSYKESVKWDNENHQKLSKLESEILSLKEVLTQKQQNQAEEDALKQTERELGEIPDPIEDRNGFNKWLLNFKRSVFDEASKTAKENSEKLLKALPEITQARELAAQQTWNTVTNMLQDNLSDKVKAKDVLDAWFEENEEDFALLQQSGIYKNKPEKFVKHILDWVKAQSYDSLKNQKESDFIKKVHKQTKENLESIGKKTKVDSKVSKRSDELEDEPETMAGKIVRSLQKSKGLRVS